MVFWSIRRPEKNSSEINWPLKKFSGGSDSSSIQAGIILPSKTTSLIIKKPDRFKHHVGDWVFIKIPAVARYVSTLTTQEQKSGVILTSTKPNIFRMLFSIKNQKFIRQRNRPQFKGIGQRSIINKKDIRKWQNRHF